MDNCSRLRHWARSLLLAAIALYSTPSAQAQDKLSDLTEPENQVLAQAVRGEKTIFPETSNPQDRTIRSKFIENLLTGVYKGKKLDRRGLIIENAIFREALNLRSVTVPVEMRCVHCRFQKNVDFSEAHFVAPLVLDRSEFTDTNTTLNFNGMKVDANFSFDYANIAGEAQFFHLEVNGDLFARHGSFAGKDGVQFGQANIKGKMFLGDSVFKSSLSLADTKMLGLNLERASIQQNLDLNHAQIQTVLDLGLKILPETVSLEGLTYSDLTATSVGKQLIDLIDRSDYSTQSYSQLEGYYRTHAYPELADETFFRMKKQERKRFSMSGYLYSLFLYILVGYGRTPQNALYISFAFVALGTVIFRRRDDVIPRRNEDASKVYSPFWYSFDLLTPFIDLHEADTWMPREEWRFGSNYARFHRILGWILVPIGIAAISGIIK